MKLYIELSSLEEGREALDALQAYKESHSGSVLFQQAVTEEPKKTEEPPAVEVSTESKAEDADIVLTAEEAKTYPSLTEVREAVKALQEAIGKEDTKKLLAEFDAKGASSVAEEDRAAFIAKAEGLING